MNFIDEGEPQSQDKLHWNCRVKLNDIRETLEGNLTSFLNDLLKSYLEQINENFKEEMDSLKQNKVERKKMCEEWGKIQRGQMVMTITLIVQCVVARRVLRALI